MVAGQINMLAIWPGLPVMLNIQYINKTHGQDILPASLFLRRLNVWRVSMAFWELTLVALGLSMDAFAVSVCKGLTMHRMHYGKALLTGGFFGVFQALMPLIGFFLGTQFAKYIMPVDHWIAFALLVYLGGKLIYDSSKSDEQDCSCTADTDQFGLKTLLVSAIATSIDALAVGITFAFLDVRILPAAAIIGFITFFVCILGVKLGNVFRGPLSAKAEVAGGVVLILIGLKILLEHLGIIAF